MADRMYPKGAQKMLQGGFDLINDDIRVALMPSSYSYSDAHEFFSHAGTPVADELMQAKSTTGGVFDADDVDFGAVDAGHVMKSLIVYKDTGDAATSPLLLYLDNIGGFPMTSTGGQVILPWSNEAERIFRIAAPFYPHAAQLLLNGELDFESDAIHVALLPQSYQYNSAHATLADAGGMASFAQGKHIALENRSVDSGVFNASHIDFGPVASGWNVGSALVYRDAGTDLDSVPVLHVANLYGVPFNTNGGIVTLQWATDSAKIFALQTP